jgi:hypothetical protein
MVDLGQLIFQQLCPWKSLEPEMGRLDGKCAFITGADGGIGQALKLVE